MGQVHCFSEIGHRGHCQVANNQRFVLMKHYTFKNELTSILFECFMVTKIYYSSWTTAAVNGGKELPILNTIALGQQNVRHQQPFQGMYLNKIVNLH